MFNLYNLLESSKWQINFQDPATPIAGRIIEIHNHVFFFLLVILVFVSWMIYKIFTTFWVETASINLVSSLTPKNKISFFQIRKVFALSNIHITHNTLIEVIWTLIPSFILIIIAIPSFGLLYAMDDIIDPEITLKTIGHQWYWSYEYSDYVNLGLKISFDSYMIPEAELTLGQLRLLEVDNSIILPLGVYVRINVTSADVLHSWAVPSLGIKIDAVPHRINSGSIFLQRTGVFYGQCSEICGVNHGFMPIVVKSVSLDNYLNWIKSL